MTQQDSQNIGESLPATVAGVDIGSLSAEAVLLEDGRMLAYSIIPTGVDSRRAAEE
ncbi:MAG: hypothetical protein GX883_02645, partial [Firmicutes bacterium]|nr:hypothetical protein [Bacillota bacterium]